MCTVAKDVNLSPRWDVRVGVKTGVPRSEHTGLDNALRIFALRRRKRTGTSCRTVGEAVSRQVREKVV
jgi:hypothetical protein